tara:strand:+ start:143 stop:535 length:393 start_codon:yes stop_codon:yes gene_type:complete
MQHPIKNAHGQLLATRWQFNRLVKNHNADVTVVGYMKPVVKWFTPDAQATWLAVSLNPKTGMAFGLCDLGLGFPELGYISINELLALRGRFGLPVERDMSMSESFRACSHNLSDWMNAAKRKQRIPSYIT